MDCAVLPLFDDSGCPRTEEDLRNRPALRGDLVIENQAIGKQGVTVRVAKLRDATRRGREPYFGDLYQPQITDMGEEGFVLLGYTKVLISEKRFGWRMQAWRVVVRAPW